MDAECQIFECPPESYLQQHASFNNSEFEFSQHLKGMYLSNHISKGDTIPKLLTVDEEYNDNNSLNKRSFSHDDLHCICSSDDDFTGSVGEKNQVTFEARSLYHRFDRGSRIFMSEEEIHSKTIPYAAYIKRSANSFTFRSRLSGESKENSSVKEITSRITHNAQTFHLGSSPNLPNCNKMSHLEIENIHRSVILNNSSEFLNSKGPDNSLDCSSHTEDDEFGDFSCFPAEESINFVTNDISRQFIDSTMVDDGYSGGSKSCIDQCEKNYLKNILLLSMSCLEQSFKPDSTSGIALYSNVRKAIYLSLIPSKSPPFNQIGSPGLSSLCEESASKILNHVWKESITYQRYMHSVGVDLHTSHRLPPFCDSLQLLEPTPVTTVSSCFPKSVSFPPRLQQPPTPPPRTSVPEFDWSSSGLTNPLEVKKAEPASSFDLAYFEKVSTKKSPESSAPVNELEAEFLCTTSIILPPPSTLDHGKTPSLPMQHQSPKMSQLVQDVLSLLPEFSYMCKSTLMFPVLASSET